MASALIEETYPSGRVVKTTLDADGDMSKVESKKNGSPTFKTYADSFIYTAAGAVSSMKLGNGNYESTIFNNRLQPTQIALGTSLTSEQEKTNLLKLDYTYGTTNNNGNVLTQTIDAPTTGSSTGFTAIQTYAYDSLNRIKSAVETVGGSPTWKQTFLYDRYGNRNFDEANTTTLGSCATNVCNPAINATDNRLTSAAYGYDAAGNMTSDALLRAFTYDAENKQTLVMKGGYKVGEYFYDGDGKRIKKIEYDQYGAEKETTIFVYDASGKMVAEYSTTPVPASEAKVSYLTNDHLGSPRITTDAGGAVISRRDFHPFGE